LPYIGGKARQAEWLNTFLPQNMKLYCEPFGGMFWCYIKGAFKADTVVYNDFNKFNANIFACARQPDRFLPHLTKIKAQNRILFNKFKQTILDTGDNFNIPDFDIAMKYVYVVTQIFSGIMSEKVEMIDLHEKYTSKYYSFINKLQNPIIRRRLDRITVHNKSYEEILDMYDGNTFNKNNYFYLDPPYYTKEHLYAFHEFGRESHIQLANRLTTLNSRWILSYYEYDELSEWFPNDKYVWIKKDYVKASMASKGKEQSVGTELLIMNFNNTYKL
jgi:DNA adenine methylase